MFSQRILHRFSTALMTLNKWSRSLFKSGFTGAVSLIVPTAEALSMITLQNLFRCLLCSERTAVFLEAFYSYI